MKHFLDVSSLSRDDIMRLVARANEFKTQSSYPAYPQIKLANLFYENSTRTRISFELAAKNLSMKVINFDGATSSASKGESIEDTLQTLVAMGIELFVIRHSQDGLPEYLAQRCPDGAHIINAGDGMHAHPSQAMLDLMTILDIKPQLQNLKIAIVGDVRHSRVAMSFQRLCAQLQIGELVFVTPEIWRPQDLTYASATSSLDEGILDADVVMCLRVQKERLQAEEGMDLATYHNQYGITQQRLNRMQPDVMILHPGPLNRGIEIDNFVADSKSSYILSQVHNGVFMRMAILESLLATV